jgi:cyclopropane fatty-acyl-phospholipid synthase-like methyltransferase
LNTKKLFPLSDRYKKDWIKKNSLGENVLYNLESLTGILDIKPGMRILDLACGKAISSIFLSNEFDVQVWAVDNLISPTENYHRIKDLNCDKFVFPLKCDAKDLPFSQEYFDIIICVDSFMYFGTDDKYIPYISRLLKKNGILGIVDICFSKEINSIDEAPDFIKDSYHDRWYYVHSLDWWTNHMEKSGLLKIVTAEITPENELIRSEYIKDIKQKGEKDEIAEAMEKDNSGMISVFRMSCKRTGKEYSGDGFEDYQVP